MSVLKAGQPLTEGEKTSLQCSELGGAFDSPVP